LQKLCTIALANRQRDEDTEEVASEEAVVTIPSSNVTEHKEVRL